MLYGKQQYNEHVKILKEENAYLVKENQKLIKLIEKLTT